MNRIYLFRHVTALVALFCLLFMQFAVAAYACPETRAEQVAPSQQTMAGCHGMDATQPALCHAHDQSGNQSLDKPEVPSIPPFIPAQLVVSVVLSDAIHVSATEPPQEPALTRATAPPLAIQNCCLRN